jgi:hypothetical protein
MRDKTLGERKKLIVGALAAAATAVVLAGCTPHDTHDAAPTTAHHCVPGTGDERVNDSPCIDCDKLQRDFGPTDRTYIDLCTPHKSTLEEERDVAVAHYTGDDLAFLLDLNDRGYMVWPQPAIDQARKTCALPKGQTLGALNDTLHFLNPNLTGSDYRIALEHPSAIPYAETFITVGVQHFCPDRVHEPFWNGADK